MSRCFIFKIWNQNKNVIIFTLYEEMRQVRCMHYSCSLTKLKSWGSKPNWLTHSSVKESWIHSKWIYFSTRDWSGGDIVIVSANDGNSRKGTRRPENGGVEAVKTNPIRSPRQSSSHVIHDAVGIDTCEFCRRMDWELIDGVARLKQGNHLNWSFWFEIIDRLWHAYTGLLVVKSFMTDFFSFPNI